jgi:intron-binding protein aquarius
MQRLRPSFNPTTGGAAFGGWSRMAIQISSFSIIEVARPAVGEVKPASVTAELTYDLAPFNRMDVRDEWDLLKEHDVVFLLCLRPPGPAERSDMESAGEDGVAATAGLRCARHSRFTRHP